jgi:hypothetical protein
MLGGRRRWWRTGAGLVPVAALGLTSCARTAAGPQAAPPPPRPAAVADAPLDTDGLVAAHAGLLIAFGDSDLTVAKAPQTSALQIARTQLRQLVGVDAFELARAAGLERDRTRPAVVSWGFTDPVEIDRILTLPDLQTIPPFAMRSRLVLPVADVARTISAVGRMAEGSACGSPITGAPRWDAWRAGLHDPADARAIADPDLLLACLSGPMALVARIDRARRRLVVTSAGGDGGLAAATAPVQEDRALAERLARQGFFSGAVSHFVAPADEARLYLSTQLIKLLAGLAGVEAEMRRALWRQGVSEILAGQRMVESPPVLFTDLMIVDQQRSWGLTEAGAAFFASLSLPPDCDLACLGRQMAGKVPPAGVFRSPETLEREIHNTGFGAYLLAQHFLWPHALAFAAAHPEASSLLDAEAGTDPAQVVALDAAGRRLRLGPPPGR